MVCLVRVKLHCYIVTVMVHCYVVILLNCYSYVTLIRVRTGIRVMVKIRVKVSVTGLWLV